jgi:hypothetical protein
MTVTVKVITSGGTSLEMNERESIVCQQTQMKLLLPGKAGYCHLASDVALLKA